MNDQTTRYSTGILPAQMIRQAIAAGELASDDAALPIDEAQVQPASLDLRLGRTAHRIRASFLPGRETTVESKIERLEMHRLDLTGGAVLEQGCVYVVPLLERLALKKRMFATANPKSSTGRLDVFVRILTDNGAEFDQIAEGYRGRLYAEITPRTFSIRVRTGSRLAQLRLRRGSPVSSDDELRRLHQTVGLVDAASGEPVIKNGLAFSVDLAGGEDGFVGYKARHHCPVIDVDRPAHYEKWDFWEPVRADRNRSMILTPDDFYILASREAVSIPVNYAAEMLAYDTLVGEFRVHYAGFFDPGFGLASLGASGTRAVLEVRSHEVPFLLEDGQIVGRLVFERLMETPDKLYGQGIGSHYQRQGLQLGKQFRP
ncbi:2'-deoxycytidine 5'-triphosphate deaminase [Oceanibacterium hippocampi]|uniref:2'-deoxycytidine 5'-triphosphate deaminase n=1 Tax=Oceanibacterium hippocampi TaxID=745714 RepID=A0A1Y5RWJ1_9PROT|nr:2'-deoxycytidine 5'-triphosphate deaminase [Oceanibacterium hippocampi]SLN26702.1 2'-deoxycytidine 5'-triphosphate deaminase [Oceanibacterium hippocampi]